jgi:hypothetical protein
MSTGARRPASCFLRAVVRRARLAAVLAATVSGTGLAAAETIQQARYSDPTTRYDHGVLGDAVEWGTLELQLDTGVTHRFVLPETLVFEDTAPRLADLDGDGAPEVIVVESSLTQGARLAVYGADGRLAQTDHIGRKNRWLAPVGAADFTGDGRAEIAMVVTPHLAGDLVLLTFDGASLTPLAQTGGLTNHRIGDRTISGGIRSCQGLPEILLAEMPWHRDGRAIMVAVALKNGAFDVRPFDVPFTPDTVKKAQDCSLNPA